MVIIKALLDIEYNDESETGGIYEVQEADILIDKDIAEVERMLATDDVALADYISDEVGYCVNEIIGYKEPDYIIN